MTELRNKRLGIKLIEPRLFLKTFWLAILSYPVLIAILTDGYVSFKEGFNWDFLNEGETYIKFFFNLVYWTAFNYFFFWRWNQKLIEKVKAKNGAIEK
jgi:hypothetical protein